LSIARLLCNVFLGILLSEVIMQTVEFDSYVENGVIAIPSQYQAAIPRSVRVIVLPKTEKTAIQQNTTNRKQVYSLGINMTGFIFDRNEINER